MKTLLLASALAFTTAAASATELKEPVISQETTVKDGGSSAAQYDGAAGGRPHGVGMATGFVAGGLGLALLGMLVRRGGPRKDELDRSEKRPPPVAPR
jgi:hypothetical protein